MLSVLGRQRDELIHSRLIGWLLVPTNRHGLGRRFLTAFLDHLWPDEALLRSGPVFADLEVTGSGPDETGRLREARADVVLRAETLTVVIENKLDAGEQPDQCERLYWAWASESGETRWVFLTPTGRAPVTATSDTASSRVAIHELRRPARDHLEDHRRGAAGHVDRPRDSVAVSVESRRSIWPMTDPFGDERLQFFLRNREDIKTWAAIERDVISATRELLARAQPSFEEQLLAIDPDVVVGRHDAAPWERILARHAFWPETVGLTIEWHRSGVDPLGGYPPKAGVFWWADPLSLAEPRSRFLEVVDRTPLLQLGFKVPHDGAWPVGAQFTGASDWWQDPAGYVETIIEKLFAVWPMVAPAIDNLFAGEPRASDA